MNGFLLMQCSVQRDVEMMLCPQAVPSLHASKAAPPEGSLAPMPQLSPCLLLLEREGPLTCVPAIS